MRHVRMLGLCVAAVAAALAVLAIAVTSASALPEFGTCIVQEGHEGKFADSNCTKKAPLNKTTKKPTGEFEWLKGFQDERNKNIVHGHGGAGILTAALRECEKGGESLGRVTRKACTEKGGTEIHTPEPIKIECEAEENTAEILGTAPKSLTNVSVKFTGCKVFGNVPCSNTPTEGGILVNPLKGTLGYLNKSKHEVGVLLEPAAKHGEFAKFVCSGFLSTVVGVGNGTEGAFYQPETTGGFDGIISPITPINEMGTEATQVFKVNPATAENIPSKLEGKHISLLETYVFNGESPNNPTDWSASGEEITNTENSVLPMEIKG